MKAVRNSGRVRINIIVAVGLVGLIAIVLLFFLSERSPEAAAQEFMIALAEKDVDTLTEMSYMENPAAPLREQWDNAVNNRAKNYVFMWSWAGFRRDSADRAVGRIDIIEFQGPDPKERETVELPLILVGGKWKVDLRSLTRNFFPALPR